MKIISFSEFIPSNAYSNTSNLYPLIIVHGLFGSKQNFRAISKALSQKTNRSVIAVDQMNHGESPHEDLSTYDSLADNLMHLAAFKNIKKFSLLGHSMGGKTSMRFALKYPHLVDKLIVLDITPKKLNTSTFTDYIALMKQIEQSEFTKREHVESFLKDHIKVPLKL
jgi:pimeloyl-ACP methyl ester carboxylesterase